MADEKVLIEIEVNNDEAVRDLEKQNKKIEKLEKSLKDLAETQGKNTLEYQKEAQQLKRVKQRRDVNKRSIDANNNSYGAMKIRLREVTLAIDRLDLSTKKGRDSLKRLRAEQNKLNTALKTGEAQGNSFSRNVGNYGDALGQVSPAASGFITQLKGMTQAARAFIATPLGLILAAIAAAFGAVVAYFKRTEEGSDKLAVAVAYLEGGLNSILDVIGNLGEFLVTYFINYFQIASNTFEIFGRTIKTALLGIDVGIQLLTGSTEEYQKAQDELAKNNEEIIRLGGEQVDLIGEILTEGAKQIKKTKEDILLTKSKAEANAALQRSENDLVKLKREHTVANAELNKEVFNGLLIAKNENESFANREKALIAATAAEQKLADNKVKVAEEEFRIAQQRSALYDSEAEEKNKVAEAEAAVIAIRTESIRTQQRIQATLLTFQKQRETARNKEIKQINDVKDAEKDLATRKEEFAISQLDNAQEIYNRSLDLLNAQYQAEKDILFTKYDDYNAYNIALQTLEQDTTEKRLGLLVELNSAQESQTQQEEARINRTRQLRAQSIEFGTSLLQNAFSIAQSLAGDDEEKQKSIAKTQAIINTAVGITKAFATLPFPAAVPAAIQVGAAGIAQLVAINNSSSGSTPTAPTGGSGNPSIDTSGPDNALAQQQALENALANLGLTVSVSEINDAQGAVSVANNTATI